MTNTREILRHDISRIYSSEMKLKLTGLILQLKTP